MQYCTIISFKKVKISCRKKIEKVKKLKKCQSWLLSLFGPWKMCDLDLEDQDHQKTWSWRSRSDH